MRKKMKRWLYALMAAAVMLGGIQMPAVVKAQESGKAARSGVTVTTQEQFMAALQQKSSPITVNGLITIGKEADSNGRMRPVKIPGGTVIQGGGTGSNLNARCPVQIEGDNVLFQNIKLTFESSDALGSVPHREIYLAGHGLTLDNVETYLEGSGGDFGGLGGSETELLPSVYAGGYPGSSLGSNASLTVRNSNDKTMFKVIHMGHGTENGNHVSYQGEAVLNLDANAVVREGVDTSQNTRASINMTGGEHSFAKAKKFVGNANTTLTLNTVSMAEAEVDSVGNVVLENKSCLSPKTNLQNITLKSGACLDYTGIDQAKITGNFTGTASGEQDRGMLVLKPEGLVVINGNITGTTQFQTGHRLFPDIINSDHPYIHSDASKGSESNFVLAQESVDFGYELRYSGGVWTGYRELEAERKIGRIEILAAPSKVDIKNLTVAEGEEPNKDIYFDIKWYDKEGKVFSDEEVEEKQFYQIDYVIRIRTECWEENVSGESNWLQWVGLIPSENYSGRYYLQSFGKEDGVHEGEYTFLFLSEPAGDFETIDDVKALKNTVIKEQHVLFYDSNKGGETPGHIHTYKGEETKKATCLEEGVMTYTCTVTDCAEQYTETIAKSDHEYKEKIMQKATCTEPGIMAYECICGRMYTEEIPQLGSGHDLVIDEAVEATEDKDGLTQGSHCSVCGTVLKEQEKIPAHKHNYQVTETKAATCTEEGSQTFTCSECPQSYKENIQANGHVEVTDPAVEPTETTDGKTEGSHCSVCGTELKKQEIIPATGKTEEEHKHTYTSKVTKAATCTDKGIKTFTCSVCEDTYTEDIAALGHKEVTDPAVEPTETTEGKTEGSHCSVCGTVLKAQETIPVKPVTPENPDPKPPINPDPEDPDPGPGTPSTHTHAYQEAITKVPTCTALGTRTFTCECGDTYTEELPMVAHQYTEKRIPAAVSSPGKVQQICSVCSAVKDEALIDGIQSFSLSRTDYVYDGKSKKPSVIIKDTKGRRLAEGADYKASYARGRINPGVYTVTVKLTGNYSGQMSGTFTIRPKKTVLRKVTPRSGGMQVTWKKNLVKTDGYQIQYSTDKKFKNPAAKVTTAKKYAVGKKISKLKPNKKYYVRIRTYKIVRTNGKSKRVYSDWSEAKTVRTKK